MPKPKNTNIHFVALSAALGGLLFGYDTAVISGAIGSLVTYFDLTPIETGWAISSALAGCLIGAFFSDFFSMRFGRKKAMLWSALFFLVSAIGTAMPDSFTMFIVFRIIGGVGVGLASMVVPMYIAEIAPAHKRGELVAFNQLAIVTGIVLVYFVNYFIALQGDSDWNLNFGWRYMFGSEAIPAILFMVLLLCVPESPRWLLMVNRGDEARKVLLKFNPPDAAATVFEEIKHSLAFKSEKQWMMLSKPTFRKALLIGIGLSVFQQVTGINAILYYAPEIFKSFGRDANAALLETGMLGVVNLLFTIVSIYLVDRLGRKPLLLIGTIGMFISLAVVGYSAYTESISLWLLPFLLLFMACFSISWGPVVWVLLSEIFPNKVRGLALAIAVFIQWVANFGVSQSFPMMTQNEYLRNEYHGAFPFIIFAGLCMLAFLFVWRYVPETKNRSLEEMGELWENRN